MPIDLKKFSETLPYSTALFGVFQPLVGWRSKRVKDRVVADQLGMVNGLVEAMKTDVRIRETISLHPNTPVSPTTVLLPSLPLGMDARIGDRLKAAFSDFVTKNGRNPGLSEIHQVTAQARLPDLLPGMSQNDNRSGPQLRTADLAANISGNSGTPLPALDIGVLNFLSEASPQTLESIMLRKPDWERSLPFFNFVDQFDPSKSQDVVLSPIGVIQLYREYFFEFRRFLGPPVGHVWVSPGGSLDVYEIHTRRTVEERQSEISTDTLKRREQSTTTADELSTAIAEQSANNTKIGVSVSGGVNYPVYHAEASATLSYEANHATSEQTAHKESRQQSEKLSEEIRNSFKTTFKTSVETQDISSRRYVLQNTTDKLVNYELRRKMRQIGIQVQHIGTQLCWQTFVDAPGSGLGLAELVHITKPDAGGAAGLTPPDAPVVLEPRWTQIWMDYDKGRQEGMANLTPPAPGYELQTVALSTPAKYPTFATVHFLVGSDKKSFGSVDEQEYGSGLTEKKGVLPLVLSWVQPDQTEAKTLYAKKLLEYTEAKRRLDHEEYVRSVQDRLRAAGSIKPRPADALREEERTVIYRQLIGQLTSIRGADSSHMLSELIRTMFDVDKMLYFVAPDWWVAHVFSSHQQLGVGSLAPLRDENIVGWGGMGRRENYLISEGSPPAPFGASIGWTIQLDGDPMRNAFLNSPWVKAAMPIRPGMERQALKWLELEHVEGSDGLGDEYRGDGSSSSRTVKEALLELADAVGTANSNIKSMLATETVFENGFAPLPGSFRAPGTPPPGTPFAVFDQWLEVLPTDQVVAAEYTAPSD